MTRLHVCFVCSLKCFTSTLNSRGRVYTCTMYMTGTLEALNDRDQIENIPEADLDGFDRNPLSDQIIKELRV